MCVMTMILWLCWTAVVLMHFRHVCDGNRCVHIKNVCVKHLRHVCVANRCVHT